MKRGLYFAPLIIAAFIALLVLVLPTQAQDNIVPAATEAQVTMVLSSTKTISDVFPLDDPLVFHFDDDPEELVATGCATSENSGNELLGAFFKYDHNSDTASFGIDSKGVIGDTDGDANPSAATCTGWIDAPDLGRTEYALCMLDTDLDGRGDAIVGDSALEDLNNIGVFTTIDGRADPYNSSGVKPTGLAFRLYNEPSEASPDLIVDVVGFSRLFTDGTVDVLGMRCSTGSNEDRIGEDIVGGPDFTEITLPARVGDFVWIDFPSQNSVQDSDEEGVPGVPVKLELCPSGEVVAETTTNAQGIYGFTVQEPGSYRVRFVPPSGYNVVNRDIGNNDAIDSDIDPQTGATECFNVPAGSVNNTLDAGIYFAHYIPVVSKQEQPTPTPEPTPNPTPTPGLCSSRQLVVVNYQGQEQSLSFAPAPGPVYGLGVLPWKTEIAMYMADEQSVDEAQLGWPNSYRYYPVYPSRWTFSAGLYPVNIAKGHLRGSVPYRFTPMYVENGVLCNLTVLMQWDPPCEVDPTACTAEVVE